MSKVSVCLWFDGQAEAAADFYCKVFKDARLTSTPRQPGGPPPMTVAWDMNGMSFIGLNGGPMFKFSEAISFSIDCADQAEVDFYWDALLAGGGEESQCGWLRDRFGVSWQVVPSVLPRFLSSLEPGKAQKAGEAMMKMKKIVIADLEAAVR
ncbi:MAG: VOC family protein [Caulobacteraceae bacterium]